MNKMNEHVKELAEFHNLNVNVVQSLYESIMFEVRWSSEPQIKAMRMYISWLEERLLHSDRMHKQSMEMIGKII